MPSHRDGNSKSSNSGNWSRCAYRSQALQCSARNIRLCKCWIGTSESRLRLPIRGSCSAQSGRPETPWLTLWRRGSGMGRCWRPKVLLESQNIRRHWLNYVPHAEDCTARARVTNDVVQTVLYEAVTANPAISRRSMASLLTARSTTLSAADIPSHLGAFTSRSVLYWTAATYSTTIVGLGLSRISSTSKH